MATVVITLTDDLEQGEDAVKITTVFDPPLTDEYIASLPRPTAAHEATERLVQWLMQEFKTDFTFGAKNP